MKTLGQFLEEAQATMCGRCGTRHVPPAKGGTCPALKEEVDYDRHFSRQSRDVQTKINHHLRQGADYPTAAIKSGATAIRVSKLAKEGYVPTADEPTEADKKTVQKVRDLLAKEKKPMKEEADRGIRMAKVMHKGQHVANVITYRGRGGGWVSGAETPEGENATKKYGIGLIDTKKEIVKKIKQYHKENNS